ncbi:MAG: hypothetical protein Kow00117_06240 [Phototrophicales bacterium]
MKRELKDGLILRSLSEGVESDRTDLPTFYESVFAAEGDTAAWRLNLWAYDLIHKNHPTVTWDDIWVVVDPAKQDEIVSALLLIPQTWHYEGVSFGVGRVELVATHKDYRQRGLVRALMDAAHERSKALGHLVQAITGIPHYYRRFGYAMSVELGARSMIGLSSIPQIESPTVTLRSAVESDIPLLVSLSDMYGKTQQLGTVWDETMFQFGITQRNHEAVNTPKFYMIINAESEPVGYIAARIWENWASLDAYVVGEKTSYLETFYDVLNGMKQIIEITELDSQRRPKTIYLESGLHHMIHTMIRKTAPSSVFPHVYAWYIRVSDVGAFLIHIAPVLEKRLKNSAAHVYTGSLTIDFFDLTGVILTFEKGRVIQAVQRVLTEDDRRDAGFPFYSFFDLIFGRRTTLELSYILPEVFASFKAQVLLDTLFPKGYAWLMGLT